MAYRRLAVLVELGVLNRVRLLYGQPALYTATREGLAWAGLPGVDPARVGVATVRHWATVRAAGGGPRARGARRAYGESRDSAAAERDAGHPIASAELGLTGMGGGGCAGRIWCCFPSMPGRGCR